MVERKLLGKFGLLSSLLLVFRPGLSSRLGLRLAPKLRTVQTLHRNFSGSTARGNLPKGTTGVSRRNVLGAACCYLEGNLLIQEGRNYSRTMPGRAGVKNGTGFQRLPLKVIPSNYDLTFEPDWTDHSFEATALIDVEVKEPTDVIVLNANKFTINGSITYTATGSTVQQEADVYLLDLEEETLKVNFPSQLAPGTGQIKITYSGVVADNLRGFFRSKYRGPGGEERFNYLTKFEPTYARYCYPCWDEPSIKTTYDITLIVPKHLVALSNMPAKEDTPHPTNPDKKVVKFERSVKMSTYVMAFAIGEFDHVEATTPDGIVCRVYTPVGSKERGRYALDTVVKSLEFYKSYFGIPYPLPKMDLLAVAEFGSGAMENWGLVVFIEQRLLVDEKTSSSLAKLYTALTTAHETAHMWFGNLVTMEWWNDLWLNEGFAKWMEYKCVDTIYPQYQIWNLFMDQYREALQLDASSSSHPIQVTVEDPAQIGSIFDTISYYKGASVIRMIHDHIGDETFREGLTHYLNQHLYGNAETKHLWQALSEKSGQKIDVIMPTFTEQMGFPLITVKSVEQETSTKKKITLSYDKFWGDAKSKCEDSTNYKWIIPVSVRTQADPEGVALKALIDEKTEKEVVLQVDSKEGEWLKLNADQVGYYRVSYPKSVLEGFVPAIKSKQMLPKDRLGILDDLFACVQNGQSKSDDLLKFMLAYENEDDSSVWSGIIEVISSLNGLLRGTPLHPKFKKYAQTLLASIGTKLGWDIKENENMQDSVLRTKILRKLVEFEAPETIQEARSRFAKHGRGEIVISGDVRGAVYRAVAAAEGETGFEALLKLYRSTDLKEEKLRILAAFGATNDKNVVQRVLEFGRGDEVIMQDIVTILYSLSDSGKNDVCWEYFKNNWEFFRDSFPTGHFLIRMVVECVTSGFKTEEEAVKIEKFFQDHHIKGIERVVAQSLENIRNSKAWLERDGSGLQEFLGPYAA